jgi:hypothetical protein
MNIIENRVENMNELLLELRQKEVESLQISINKPNDDISTKVVIPIQPTVISQRTLETLGPLELSAVSHMDIHSTNLSLHSLLDLSASSSSSSSSLLHDSSDIDSIGSSTVREILSSSGQVIENLVWSTVDVEENQLTDASVDPLPDIQEDQPTITSDNEEDSNNLFTHHRGNSLTLENMEDSMDQLSEDLEESQNSHLSELTESLDYVEVSPRDANDSMYSISEGNSYECKDDDDDDDDGYIALLNSTSQSYTVDPLYESHLEILSASGFQNRKINLALLKEYDGNVEEVANALKTYEEIAPRK